MEFSKRDLDAINTLRRSASPNTNGLHRGRIESIDDPDRQGRVKVRVFSVHGDEFRTPTRSLPWAEIAEPGGGGYDFGSFNPPPVGSTVWIGFEDGLVDFPVVLGTFRGIPKRNEDNPNIMLVKDGEPLSEKAWRPPDDENETPKDIFEDVYGGDPHPTRRVWSKSYKGHTILIEDGDGKEFLRIIDRAGQVISMECPVAKEYNDGNKAQRGVRDSIRGDQLPHEIIKNKRAFIRIKDLSGQELTFNSVDQDESIILKSRSRDGKSTNKLELRSGKGRESIELSDSAGDKVFMDPNSTTPIVIMDSSGNSIVFDKENGKVRIVSAKSSEEEAQQKTTTINGSSTESIKGDKESKILGNSKTSVVQDLNLGVLGNTNASFGGALQVVCTSQDMEGTVPDNAIDIKVQQPSGSNISIDNIKGNINVSTTLGNIDLGTVAGNARLSSSLGNASVEAQSLAIIDAAAVHLGGTPALESVLKGTTLISSWLTLLSTLGSGAGSAVASVGSPPQNAAAIVALAGVVSAYASALITLLPKSLSSKVYTK